MSMKNNTINESCVVNGENKKEINWNEVKNVDFSMFYKTIITKKGTTKKGDPMLTMFLEGPEFYRGIYLNILDKGVGAKLRFEVMSKSVLNYEGDYVTVIDFSLEFKKYINGFVLGFYPNASTELFHKNAIYRNGLDVDTNELIESVRLYNPKSTGKKNWKRVGVAYITLKCGTLKNVAILDCSNSHLPKMMVCNHARNASLPIEERIDDIVLTKAVKNRLLSMLVADKRIVLAPSKTGERFTEEIQSQITGIYKKEKEEAEDYMNEVAFTKEDIKEEEVVLNKDILLAMTIKDLKKYCKENNISIKSSLKKEQIVNEVLLFINKKTITTKESNNSVLNDCELDDMDRDSLIENM